MFEDVLNKNKNVKEWDHSHKSRGKRHENALEIIKGEVKVDNFTIWEKDPFSIENTVEVLQNLIDYIEKGYPR